MAQFDNELSLSEGDMVYLRRYVDCEWIEGALDGEFHQFEHFRTVYCKVVELHVGGARVFLLILWVGGH